MTLPVAKDAEIVNSPAVVTDGLGKRYGKRWALQDCSLNIPRRRVVGLVGANGAGKSTLLQLVVGLLGADTGSVEVLGESAGDRPELLGRVGFLAQDAPLYGGFTIADHLRMGAHMNSSWDGAFAAARIEGLKLDQGQRAGQLSGGQRAQLALTLAVAKRPELLVLDEPVAGLDPLARREFLRTLMSVVTESSVTVVLSSHLLADIERVCDHLIILAAARVQIAGDVDELLSTHRVMTGPRRALDEIPDGLDVISSAESDRQTVAVVRGSGATFDARWSSEQIGLEELVLAYMGYDLDPEPERRSDADRRPQP